MNQDAIWIRKNEQILEDKVSLKQQITKLSQERNNYIINTSRYNTKDINDNEIRLMIYLGQTDKIQNYKAEFLTEIFEAIEKDKVALIIIIKQKWKKRGTDITILKEIFKNKKPNFYINENDDIVLIKNRYIDKPIVLEKQGLQIQPWIKISKKQFDFNNDFNINMSKTKDIKQKQDIGNIIELNKWSLFIKQEARIIETNEQSLINSIILAINTNKEEVRNLYEDRICFFKRNIKNKLYIEAIIQLIQNINQNNMMNIQEDIKMIKQVANIAQVKVQSLTNMFKEGYIDSRLIDMTFLQDSKKTYWSMLAKFYKHDKRETFYNTHITKTIWNQITEYFKGKMQPYKPYRLSVSEIELTDTKILISKDQVCYPKSNALDKEGFDASMIIKYIYNNIKRKYDQDEQYINIMIGPLIASIMTQTGAKNIARTFYLLKKNDEVIDKMEKVRILYILPSFLRVFESSTFYIIAQSIAEKVNENEIINFASLKGLSAKNMLNKIKEEWKEGNKKAIIQLDLSRAFDSVEHANLKKAIDYYYGVTDKEVTYVGFKEVTIKTLMLKWLDIITNMATYNDDENNMIYKNIGLPMGSSLSPAMFVLYLNYVLKDYPYKRCHYSDDTYVIVNAQYQQIDNAIIKMEEYLNKANMKLNLNKSKLIIKQSNLDENIQQLSKKYNLIIQTQLDVLGLTLSMQNLTQIKTKLPNVNSLKDLIDSNLSFSSIIFVLNNATFGAALYRANTNNDVDEEIMLMLSYIYTKLKSRWKFLSIRHLVFIMPRLIEAIAIRPVRSEDEEQRKVIFKRLSAYKDNFKGMDKNEFLNLLKKIKINEDLEKSNEQLVEEYIKNKNLMGISVDMQEKKEMIATLNKERQWGLKAWKNALKETIKQDFGLEDAAQVLWANELIKKEKPILYIWIIKLLDKSTRESRDNFIFRKMIQAINIVNKDQELRHVEKINQIYEQLVQIKGIQTDKKTKEEINHYKQILRNTIDKQLAWKIYWLSQIKEDVQDQKSTEELNQEEEVQLGNYASSLAKSQNIPFYEKEKKARRKMLKSIAQTADILISILDQKRYSIKELDREFYKILDSLAGQESTKDFKEVVIIKNQFTELIEMNFR